MRKLKIEDIKKKHEEEPAETEEKEETLQSLINILKEKYKKQDE